jgi:anti-sigma regulatory factor (Ser/Thr protein kinase)
MVVDKILRDLENVCPPQDNLAMKISLVEMIMNAVEHGNLAIGYERKHTALLDGTYEELVESRRHMEPYASRQVTVEYIYAPRWAVFTIRDEGAGFDWRAIPEPKEEEQLRNMHGRGILIARANMDKCVFHKQGNVVTLVKYFTLSCGRYQTTERMRPCKLRAS